MSTASPFLAVDGEATEGDYTLLCRTGSHPLTDLRSGGLHTIAVLEYLLAAPRPTLQVCFGLGYDVNNWLRDLPRPALEQLWERKICYWRNYRIEWIPKISFSVKAVDGRYAQVTEVFGFFQTSFVRSLEAWKIGAPTEIARMKGERGSFTRAAIADVTRYCQAECGLLVELMSGLRGAFGEAGIMPARWIGAGAAASALLRSQGVKDHHRYDLDLGSEHIAKEVVQGAYFGGRVELLHQGVHHNIVSADLKSAYPAAMRELPSLRGAKLVKRKRFNPNRHGVWKVSWDLRGGEVGPGGRDLLAPFPVRVKQSIFYPLAGEGHYHGVEVAAAIALGYPVDVHYGYVLQGPHVAERPFAWVPDVYRKRARFVREGRAAEKAVKLALNSSYGKLAQGDFGYSNRPPFQSYFWAGYVTAATRARVLTAAAGCVDPIMIATDGIFARKLGKLGPSQGIGNWERGSVDRLFAAQPGVYEAVSKGRSAQKSRGFFASEIDYAELQAGFEVEGADYAHHYESTRFNGLGSSLSRKDFAVWRRWITERRSILLWPERKIAQPDGRLLPFPGRLVSEPYKPKISLVDARALDQLDGMDQPMVIEI